MTPRAPNRRCTTSFGSDTQSDGRMKSLGRMLTAMITPVRRDGRRRRRRGVPDRRISGRERQRRRRRQRNDRRIAGARDRREAARSSPRSRSGWATRGTVIAGTGGNNTQHSVELTKARRETGVDAILAVVPYYNKPTQDGLLRTLRGDRRSDAECRSSCTTSPAGRASNMLPETTHELARRHRNIVGQKESTGNVEQHARSSAATRGPKSSPCGRATTTSTCRRWRWARYGLISVAGHIVGRRAARDGRRVRSRQHGGGRRASIANCSRCSPRCSRSPARSR